MARKHAAKKTSAKKPEMVDRPAHYTKGKIMPVDYIDDQGFGFYEGTIVKYIARYRHKRKPVEDLEKAAWYLARLIELTKAKAAGAQR